MLRYNFLFELFSPSHWMSILKCHSLINKNSSEKNRNVLIKKTKNNIRYFIQFIMYYYYYFISNCTNQIISKLSYIMFRNSKIVFTRNRSHEFSFTFSSSQPRYRPYWIQWIRNRSYRLTRLRKCWYQFPWV